MKPSRGEKKSSTVSLAKTLATSLILGGAITFVAMFYALYTKGKGLSEGLFEFYFPWCLSYGILALALAVYGVINLTNVSSHLNWLKPLSIGGIVGGALIALSAFPVGIFLSSTEFMISLLVIGVCILAIGILTLRSYKEEF